MLDPWIIEEILRREREEKVSQRQQPRLELPLMPPCDAESEVRNEETEPGGYEVVDFYVV
jgi:hypothetical protein